MLGPAVAALAMLAMACGSARQPLNSELIEDRYGNYGIDVLDDDGKIRRSMLYSINDGVRVCRTYALVQYKTLSRSDAAAVGREAAAIRGGASMGSTFAASGWQVHKDSLHTGLLPSLPADHALPRMMQLGKPTRLAYYVYRFTVERAGRRIPFATIAEVYHPDFFRIDDLERRYRVSERKTAQEDFAELEAALLVAP